MRLTRACVQLRLRDYIITLHTLLDAFIDDERGRNQARG